MLEPSSSPTNLLETTDLPVPTPLAATPTGSSIIIDHRSIELFDQIPDTFLEAARNLHIVFTDFSVGNNIDQGLNCLAASTWAESRPGCRRDFVDSNWNYKLFFQSDLTAGNLPARIHFQPDPLVYNRDRWLLCF